MHDSEKRNNGLEFQKIPSLKITYYKNHKITPKTGGIYTRWKKRLLKREQKTKKFNRLKSLIIGYDGKGEHQGKERQ